MELKTATLKFEPADDFVIARIESTATQPAYNQYMTAVVEYCGEHDFRKVLLDERQLLWPRDIFVDYDLAEWMVGRQIGAQIKKLACVTTPERFQANSDFETLSLNRGINFRACQSMEAAVEWLTDGRILSQPPSPSGQH